jgi:uncharacterized protein
MFLLDGVWVASATDLVSALRCEYQLLARRAEKAGLVPELQTEDDQLLARAAELGLAHERQTLLRLEGEYGTGPKGVVSIEQPSTKSRAELEAAHAATLAAMQGGAAIVFQAAFFDGTFHGLADFLVRVDQPDGTWAYEPADTKFARHAKVEALLQLASYAFQVEQMGFARPEQVHLWLGDGTQSSHRNADLRPVYVDRTARIRALLDAPIEVPEWGVDEVRWCGWCSHCRAAADARSDVLLVAGMRAEQRRKLVAAGIDTIAELAAAPGPPPGLGAETFAKLQAQAVLQAKQDASPRTEQAPDGEVTAELADPSAIALIPPPNAGDVFFDFEGDPLHLDDAWGDLGLEYLWGILTHDQPGTGTEGEACDDGTYWPLWAHDRTAERQALETFIDWLTARRRQPGLEGLHVYHYAPYEITALKRLVQRYGTRADELDVLLRDGVFVDLYGIVRRSVRVSQRSYSIKKLEPLYMQGREAEVTGGAESVVEYAEYREAVADGDAEAAAEKLANLHAYNRDDCVSTLLLRDWLRSQPGAVLAEHVRPDVETQVSEPPEPSEAQVLAQQLRAPLIDLPPAERTPAQQVVAMLAAALEYHRREVLPTWWDHFRRLAAPAEEWDHDGEMIVLRPDRITVTTPWHRPARTWRRTFQAVVDLPGSFKLTPGDRKLHAIYDPPLADHLKTSETSDRGYAECLTLDDVEPHPDGSLVTLTQVLPQSVGDIDELTDAYPSAVANADALEGRGQAAAILALVRQLESEGALDLDAAVPPHPALDVLARRPPRLVGLDALPPLGDQPHEAIGAAVRALDRSYLAVQGPPGTGKSTTGAKAIAALVQDGWKVGVVAQSHRTIEALLDKAIDCGLAPEQVVKKEGKDDTASPRWTELSDAGLLARSTAPAGEGCLIGGTSWDFVSDKRVPAGSLDLLVIDEAGQFSLADTIAVSRAAPRLLLLGDPQQLSQVSQATHPEPVQRASLDWLADGHDTLPAELGYFLPRTYRMHPALTEVVSELAYDGRLAADGCTAERTLDGVPPGVITDLVPHDLNRAASPEEVEVVATLVADLVGRTWTDPNDRAHPEPRALGEGDIVVVAPYNAQVNRIRTRLLADGYPGVAVGTVDRFQGREAPVVIVSMASSSAAATARGSGFLLSRHRLNVAISRAQHTAYLVHAPQLTELVPASPAGLARLGSFLAVSHAGRGR